MNRFEMAVYDMLVIEGTAMCVEDMGLSWSGAAGLESLISSGIVWREGNIVGLVEE